MRVAVLVKQVPDSWAVKRLRGADLRLDREACDRVLNDLDEYAVEQALVWQEQQGAHVTLISMGPSIAEEALRRGLSMGADEAILVSDDALAGADARATARVLAAAVQKVAPDIVLCGVKSTDAGMSVVPGMVAAALGWPGLTHAAAVDVSDGQVRVRRETEHALAELNCALPALVSVIEKINTPRYPNFKGILAAKKKQIDTWSLADIGLSSSDVVSITQVTGGAERPARSSGVQVVDASGDSAAGLVAFLESRKVI